MALTVEEDGGTLTTIDKRHNALLWKAIFQVKIEKYFLVVLSLTPLGVDSPQQQASSLLLVTLFEPSDVDDSNIEACLSKKRKRKSSEETGRSTLKGRSFFMEGRSTRSVRVVSLVRFRGTFNN